MIRAIKASFYAGILTLFVTLVLNLGSIHFYWRKQIFCMKAFFAVPSHAVGGLFVSKLNQKLMTISYDGKNFMGQTWVD